MKNSGNIIYHQGKVTKEDRYRVLGQKGLIVWLTGLSGSGKSTIAVETEKILNGMGKAVYRLDGDNIRFGLNSDLGFSEKDRFENIRRISEVCALFQDAGLIVIASFISPLAKMRQMAREKGKENFIEVYVKADLETCIKRDPKGLYCKALNGEIQEFTGISAPYEEPENPDLVLDTQSNSPEECVKMLVDKILEMSKLE
ncbi:adenylyl-sulfate kinase CysC [Thermoclostridium stercorarium subsp. stercorarium DSM 8532]|jgi:adenylyl-sulfate kinase|uniref:Adenylyl-sulfate kinase n=3 Tax=Thermoclostridium stercorarium TaxID=1510 RepID=L7VKJ8_THES1|nr:adenylyl-sulfate kinase [Thermoclostridium stercorarium]AGC67277.1 adenylyl-sulfate kinase CysC [Thermoclostridium stercorarium subsp. stercorarium DSM 8532]AGI38343.1 adenylylsulfate kinase [Thermoclostridium stercorarium subsp. stercorarium DSM 8532]ANW97780.1 adenylyl-sulfate kinase [Thermoclostridium stercorarium subsp. thermolacticum DSM 2910]ANX00306.1 adenylyl-sulfate kinase [Thermoclostridium stercorarium subsp. leptospartum DSM 9219]